MGGIAKLSHYVSICGMEDVVEASGVMSLARKAAFEAWAAIEMKKASSFSKAGYNVDSAKNEQTHEIYIRYRTDFEISHMAWVFEERLMSSPRWFKILKVADKKENGQYWCLSCQLVERSDDVTPPVSEHPALSIATPLPQGVKF